MTDKIIRVGVGVVVLNDKNQFIMGKRKNTHGAGGWSIPGGHVEFGETLEEAAYREVLEETGFEIGDLKIVSGATHFFDNKTRHFVAVYLIGRVKGGSLEIREPDKIETWKYFDDWKNLPQPLFVDYSGQVNFRLIEEYISNNNA